MLDVNWLAILLCGVASMVLGFLWYGPLFGKPWMQMMGIDPNNQALMEQMKKGAQKSYGLMFLGSLVMAYIFAHFLVYASDYTNTVGVSAGLSVGFWAWLGFIAPVTLGSILWEGKSWKLWILNNGYNLLQLLVFGLILSTMGALA